MENIRKEGKDKATKLRQEEQHIDVRKTMADDVQISGEQQHLQTELSNAERELSDIEKQAMEAEARKNEALRREHLWKLPAADGDAEDGLRSRLASVKAATEVCFRHFQFSNMLIALDRK